MGVSPYGMLAENGHVIHKPTGRSLNYGALVEEHPNSVRQKM